MLELRDLFYDMENIISICWMLAINFLERLNQEQQILNSLNLDYELKFNTEQLVDFYKRHGSREEVIAAQTEIRTNQRKK